MKLTWNADPKDRLMSNVEIRSDGCWHWIGAMSKSGYGKMGYKNRHRRAHCVAYELFIGDIPEGHHVHHEKCRNRDCVNPDHLLAKPGGKHISEHFAEQTHCKQGHEFTAENTFINTVGARTCRVCCRARVKAHRERNREHYRELDRRRHILENLP